MINAIRFYLQNFLDVIPYIIGLLLQYETLDLFLIYCDVVEFFFLLCYYLSLNEINFINSEIDVLFCISFFLWTLLDCQQVVVNLGHPHFLWIILDLKQRCLFNNFHTTRVFFLCFNLLFMACFLSQQYVGEHYWSKIF